MNLFDYLRPGSVLVFAAVLPATSLAGTRFVDAASTNAFDDGTSWEHAYRGPNGLRKALEFAGADDEIWVARGTYLPTRTGDRTQSFFLFDRVAVYGGFAGGEKDLDERNPEANVTILSGDLAGDDASAQYADNSVCVLRMRSAVLDGFTITGGYADGPLLNGTGAGIQALDSWAEPVVRRCVIRNNQSAASGAGVRFEGIRATFQECRFVDNIAGGAGGAAYVREVEGARFEECLFEGNIAADGGAVAADHGGVLAFLDCRFEGNSAGSGGAVSGSSSYESYFGRCVVTGNTATNGSVLQLFQGTSDYSTVEESLVAGNFSSTSAIEVNGATSGLDVIASTIAGNTGGGIRLGFNIHGYVTGTILVGGGSATSQMTIRYSCTDSLQPGTGNIAADPQFVDAPGGNYRLEPTSPCIDAVESYHAIPGYDIERTCRREDVASAPDSGPGLPPIQDMGAYETHGGLFTLACAGDSRLTRDCPCGHVSWQGSGCVHSGTYTYGWGGMLVAYGTAQPDTVGIRATGLRGNVASILLQGNAIDGTGFVLGDGVRCIQGSLKRLYFQTTSQSGAAGFPAPNDPGISARSAALGDTILPGERRHYQVWYRDPSPTFCPPPAGGTTNLSSGITVYW